VAAVIVRAIDQETANASGPHLGEGDLLRASDGLHCPIKPQADPLGKSRYGLGPWHLRATAGRGLGSQQRKANLDTQSLKAV